MDLTILKSQYRCKPFKQELGYNDGISLRTKFINSMRKGNTNQFLGLKSFHYSTTDINKTNLIVIISLSRITCMSCIDVSYCYRCRPQRGLYVCMYVSVFGTSVSCAKTAEPIGFGVVTCGPNDSCIRLAHCPHKKGQFKGNMYRPMGIYMDSLLIQRFTQQRDYLFVDNGLTVHVTTAAVLASQAEAIVDR